jgi:Chromo (CHRromatin Organisation MOdifier) domain
VLREIAACFNIDPIEGCHPHPPPLPEIIDGEEEWVVKKILDSKIMNRKLCYLVKWEGFGVEHNSWEPWDNIHAPERVVDFHQRHPGAAHHIRAIHFNSIPFCSLPPPVVPRHHSLEGGVDVRGHPLTDNRPPFKVSQSADLCHDNGIVTGHNRPHIEAS